MVYTMRRGNEMKEASLSSNQEPSYRSISMESDSQPVHAKGLSPPVRQYESGQPPMSRRLRKKMQQKRREEDQSQKWNQSQEVRSVLLEEESPNNELSTDVDGKTNHETATQGAHFSSSAAVKASAQRLAQRRMSGALEVKPMSTKMQYCVDILVTGHVEAYIDFFYLTHRLDEENDPPAVQPPHRGLKRQQHSGSDEQAEEMTFLQQQLCGIEKATRNGNKDSAIDCYYTLSNHFRERTEYPTAAYFLERCLEFSRANGDTKTEMRTAHELAKVHGCMDEHDIATEYNELHRRVAEEEQDRYESRVANQQLIKTYSKRAQIIENRLQGSEREKLAEYTKRNTETAGTHRSESPSNERPLSQNSSRFAGSEVSEEEDPLAEAIELYMKALEAAQMAGDREAEGKTCYAIGKVYINQEKPDDAIYYLRSYLSIAKSMHGDEAMEAQGQAYAALAAAYQKIGGEYAEKAMQCLSEFLKVAENTDNLDAQADACINLGSVASKNNELDEAVNYFERAYRLRRRHAGDSEDSRKATERARMLLGMARGNAKMGAYVNVVNSDMSSLLQWKVRRTDNISRKQKTGKFTESRVNRQEVLRDEGHSD